MNKPKVRNVFKKILAILICPFILTGCSLNDECNVEGRHVHKYVGKNSKGTITNYIDLDYFGNTERKCIEVGYFDGGYNRLHYYRTDEYIDLTKEDEEFYRAKGSILFKGEDNWDYLYNVMATKRDYMEYQFWWDDGEGYVRRWTTEKDRSRMTGRVRVSHYQFCGHKLTYKDGKWVDERSPFVDDIREIIDEYPYFQLDCYKVIEKEYEFDESVVRNIKLEDIDEFNQPDLENKELHSKEK